MAARAELVSAIESLREHDLTCVVIGADVSWFSSAAFIEAILGVCGAAVATHTQRVVILALLGSVPCGEYMAHPRLFFY